MKKKSAKKKLKKNEKVITKKPKKNGEKNEKVKRNEVKKKMHCGSTVNCKISTPFSLLLNYFISLDR